MRFLLHLNTISSSDIIPINYQYPLSSAIYKIIHRADAAYSAFLHNRGYGGQHKQFKLFTFSDLQVPFTINTDRLVLKSNEAKLVTCFYMPATAENFIKGLFLNQKLEIADRQSKCVFNIAAVESVAENIHGKTKITVQPLSPIAAGRKNERGYYDYLSPENENFTACLYHNWMQKCITAGLPVMANDDAAEAHIEVMLLSQPPQQRLITIKAGTSEQTKVKGYKKFRLELTAPEEMLEVALGTGLGLYNSQGFGCVEVVRG